MARQSSINVIYKNITDVHPDPGNPRHNDNAVPAVQASIEKFGWNVPIVIDKNGMILSGHTRYKAAINIGLKKIPCICADNLTEKQRRAFQLADNKTGELSVWDTAMLAQELSSLASVFDMTQFGFEKKQTAEKQEKQPEKVEPKKEDEGFVICPRCGCKISKVTKKHWNMEEDIYE